MIRKGLLLLLLFVVGLALFPAVSQAVPPVVKTVPWVATNPLIPHDTWSGKSIRLKGTSDVQGATIQYTWDFGDGSPVVSGPVTNMYAIEASHAYTGATGTIYTARLTVQNTNTSESANKEYYVAIRDQTLSVEVNVAIDEGLWYLHKTQARGGNLGYWTGQPGVTATNVNAFEVNGHLESGVTSNPYTETVARGMRYVFTYLNAFSIGLQTAGNPDSNGNGYGVQVTGTYPPYQGGMVIDAIVASGTPDAVTTTGPAPSGANPGILGRTYQSIVQDMVDAYSFGQNDPASGSYRGGWRYGWNYGSSDNSVCQWAAIGIIAATRTPAHFSGGTIIDYWAVLPAFVKTENQLWLNYSDATDGTGRFGYDRPNYYPWGTYAVTPSGMVQLVMNGIGRGNALWDRTETFFRNNFCNTGGAGNAIRDYYYGLFSFVKSMLLHDSNNDGISESIQLLGGDLDWYANQGSPCDGVARTLVGDQLAAGYWSGHNYSGDQYPFETGWAIIMLNRTIFEAGAPVAVAEAVPNPGVVGSPIKLSGSASFHQDPSKSIDSWEWDFNNDGVFDASGPMVTVTYPALGTYPVKLRVTDDGSPEKSAETIVSVLITTPPVGPTASANGPYVFCPQAQPWFLDGKGSVNPDEGMSLPGYPGDTIQQYAWDLDGDRDFNEAFGSQPDVTAYFVGRGPGDYLISLRVTDTTSTSFPGLAPPFNTDLSDEDSAVVSVKAADDPQCGCVDDLAAISKLGKVQLNWTHTGAVSYNVYRSTISGGPYLKIANTTSTYSLYLDTNVVAGATYYYVVRPAALNGNELCQSNEASVTVPTTRRR